MIIVYNSQMVGFNGAHNPANPYVRD